MADPGFTWQDVIDQLGQGPGDRQKNYFYSPDGGDWAVNYDPETNQPYGIYRANGDQTKMMGFRAGENGALTDDSYDISDNFLYKLMNPDTLGMLAAAAVGGGLASGWGGAGAGAAPGAAGGASGGFAIPTAAELTAAGMSPGGMAMTGAGGIGSVSSAAGALGPGAYGALGYTGAAALPELGAGAIGAAEEPFFLDPNGMAATGPGGVGEVSSVAGALGPESYGALGYTGANAIPTWQELAEQGFGSGEGPGVAATGPGGVGEVGSVAGELGGSAAGWSGLASGATPAQAAMQAGLNAVPAGGAIPGASAATPAATTAATSATSGLLKSLAPGLIRALIGGTTPTGTSGASGSGSGGFFGGNATPGNMTPGAIAQQAAPTNNNQQIAQALMLGQAAQPQFNFGGYQQVPDMAQFAKALQGDQYNG